MKRTIVSEIPSHTGEVVSISGWVHTIRKHGKITFLVIRDRSGTIQVVSATPSKSIIQLLKELTLESVVSVEGLIKKEPQAPGGFEMQLESIEVLSHAQPKLPIPVSSHTAEETLQSTRLDWRWIDLRREDKRLLFEIWTTFEAAIFEYFVSHGFIRIHSPKLMSAASENVGELFTVPYFGKMAYLAQSCQFYKQMAMAAGFEKIFEFGPVFRANKAFTPRHDTEFTQFDFEISFIESHQDIMKVEEELIVAALTAVKKKHGDAIKKQYGVTITVPSIPFPQLTMTQVKEKLKPYRIESARELDTSPEEERTISEIMQKETGHEFLFVTDWPKETRAFYHMRYPEKPSLTKSFDLLWKGWEITTGAQREHRPEVLLKQAEEKGIEIASIEQYVTFFKYGCPPHGGLGFGPSRFLARMLDIDDVREVTYLYRGVKRLTP